MSRLVRSREGQFAWQGRDRNRRPEGGEWEPIKISLEIQPVGLYPKITQALKRSDQSLE